MAELLARRPRLRRCEPDDESRHAPPRPPAGAVRGEFMRGSGGARLHRRDGGDLDYDYRDRLGEIACPTLIVWGARDKVVTARDAAVYERLIPNARKVIFADTGHMAMLERPAALQAAARRNSSRVSACFGASGSGGSAKRSPRQRAG